MTRGGKESIAKAPMQNGNVEDAVAWPTTSENQGVHFFALVL